MTSRACRRTFLAGLTLACLAPAAGADHLRDPEGPVILTVSGAIAHHNAGDEARFDLDMLRALDAREVTTSTIWTEGAIRFTGVSLDVLLAHVGASGSTVAARAINDYTVEIPASDATPEGALLAYGMNGAPMSRRDKGPLWVIYPFDASVDYRSEVIYSRSIWQLDRMEIRE
ncbi:MAG: oxidoreductase [Rhodobacteraceae bacterium]|nr:MAG: oxidoreductase [Paracoccaceae bacterium]